MSEGFADLRRCRLPRGRHGLPREIVTSSQRERLLAAVVRVSAEKGYEATTVGDILAVAGVGRESFYELFDDKLACMRTAHALLVEDLEAQVRAAYEVPGPWVDRVSAGLAAALGWFAADPAAGRFVMVEMSRVGPGARERLLAVFTRFTALLDAGFAATPDLPRAARLALGGTVTRVYEAVVSDRTAELPGQLPELTFELLVPFVGEETARAERGRLAAGR
ncbi:MAG: TetR/AcrR family transcriptional regulator [Solirubrobacterales bacterium]